MLVDERSRELQQLDRTIPDYVSCRRSLEQAIEELVALLANTGQKAGNWQHEEVGGSMAVQHEVDSDSRLVRTRFSGTVTHWDHSEHLMRLRCDPAFDPTFSELVCFDERADIHLGFMDFRSEGDPFCRTSKRAIVASHEQPTVYGMARMFQLARGDDCNVRMFETIGEATTWLEVT